MSVPAKINSKITFIPAKNNIRETAQQVKILFKCSYHLHGALGENDLLQRPLYDSKRATYIGSMP